LACLRAIESIAKARVPIRSCLMVAAIKKRPNWRTSGPLRLGIT
jgi:hypothetical protein